MNRITDEELINELKRLDNNYSKVTSKLMKNKGKYSANTYNKRFGSWNNAKEKVGVEINKEMDIDKNDLIKEMIRLKQENGYITCELMNKKGKYSIIPYNSKFGSWNEAVKEAGLEINMEMDISKRKLIYELKRLNIVHGNVHYELIDNEGLYTTTAYERAFGTINSALEEAGLEKYVYPTGNNHPNWKGGYNNLWYGENWPEQRKKALKRDEYQCSLCNNENDYGLVVHHIKPARKFNIEKEYKEMNREENLITICRGCHMKVEGKCQDLNAKKFKNRAWNFQT